MENKFKFLFFVILLAASILFISLPYAFAVRPLTTDDAWTVEKGVFQLETGFDIAWQRNHDKEYGPSLTLSYGLLDRMDLGIGTGYLFVRPEEGESEQGLGDTEVKAKYRLLDEKKILPAFSVAGIIKAPTASQSRGLGSGEFDFGFNLIATKNLSKRLVLHANVGYNFIGEEGAKNEMNYALGSQFVLTDNWALVGEIVGANNFNGKKDDPLSALFGTYYEVTKKVIVDAGVGIGLNSAAPDYRITAGVTLLF